MGQKLKAYRKSKVFILLLVIMTTFFCTAFLQKSDLKARVLFISSYSESFDTVPEQIRGIKEVFQENNISVDFEYMDAKRFDLTEDTEWFYSYLSHKLARLNPYDAILVGDDHALQFILDYQEELFADLPVVFLGVGDYSRVELAKKRGNITGVIEKIPLQETIEIAKELNPNARKVLAIVDNSLTAIGDTRQFYTLENQFPDLVFEDINCSEYFLIDIGNKLEAVEDDTILLYLSMFTDKTGIQLTITESTAFIARHTKIPVYRASVGGVGDGIFGGKLISYYEMARMASYMIVDIVNGKAVEEIEIIEDSFSQFYFDYNLLETFDIDEDLLPEDTILINKELTFYEQYKNYVIGALIIVFVLFLFIVVLIIDNIRVRRAERKLLLTNEELSSTYEELTAQEEELRAQYNTIQENLENIQELNKKKDKIAKTDYLTGLPNRKEFTRIVEEEIDSKRPFALIFLDIDNFKHVNDSIGHMYADEILVELANRFRVIMDEKMLISRFSGDEFFVMIFGENHVDTIDNYAKKIMSVFDKSFMKGMRENYLSSSAGITLFPRDGSNINQLLINADTAMYQVKETGKSNYLFYNDNMKKELRRRIDTEAILRDAIKNDGFKLLYQPKVDVKTGFISGFEALLRLKDHNIAPGYFIKIAEESNLIINISRWVTEEAIKEISRWKQKGFEAKPVSVNFSVKQIRDLEFIPFLAACLEENDVEADLIEIEITENILLENTEVTIIYLNKLREIGVKIVLDDFGKGYSSINYLTFLSVETVKLDKSLCDRFLELNNAQVIGSIISLAHGLGMEITAEGIEESEHYFRLREEGCDYIQGYLFSRPLDVEEIDKIYNINMLIKLS